MSELKPQGDGLPRYGIKWNGNNQPISTPVDDGYWTPYHLALAQNAELASENDSLKSSLKRSYEANDHLNDQHKDLAVMKHTRFNNEECWIFDEDSLEENHLESLVCPVVIRSKKLREIFTQNAELVAQVAYLTGVMQSMADSHLEDGETEAAEQFLIHINKTPTQHLRDRDAEVGRVATEQVLTECQLIVARATTTYHENPGMGFSSTIEDKTAKQLKQQLVKDLAQYAEKVRMGEV